MNKLQHVVLIPDGNRRWAQENFLGPERAYTRGVSAVSAFFRACRDFEVKVATVWGFSTENWKRQPKEVNFVMDLINQALIRNMHIFSRDQVKFVHIGREDRIKQGFQKLYRTISEITKSTAANSKLIFNLALDYGGRDEIARACQKIIRDGITAAITPELFANYLDTAGQPDPDLIIRTSGERRLSGILPFQSDYAEIEFFPKALPEINAEHFTVIFEHFLQRERRHGGNRP